jgi:hypothetical protein
MLKWAFSAAMGDYRSERLKQQARREAGDRRPAIL